MQLLVLLSFLLYVRTPILIECLPLLRRLPVLMPPSDMSIEDALSTDEYVDSMLSPRSPMNEPIVIQDDADLEDVLRDILEDLSSHDDELVPATERTRELVETYDFDTEDGEGYAKSLRRYSSKSYGPYPYSYDVDEEDVKVVSRTSYHWRVLEKTLRRMALDSTKVQIAYNIIREKQVNFHPASSVYKILEKSVNILHTTKKYFDRPPPPIRYSARLPYPPPSSMRLPYPPPSSMRLPYPPPSMRLPYPPPSMGLPYPPHRGGGGRRGDNKRYFLANKLARMNRRLTNQLSRMGTKLVRKPVEMMYKYF